jgi:hypothetical protein
VVFLRTFRLAAIRAKISRTAVIGGVGCGLLLMTAACAAQGASAVPASAAATSRAAYVTCLRQHGMAVPTAKPTAKPTGQKAADDKIPAVAREACASLRPANGMRKRHEE